MQHTSGEKKRLHLGVLFGTLDDMSQYVLYNGINEYAKTNDIHLTAYFGAYQAKYRDLASHYEMCMEAIRNSTSLDGLIICSGYIIANMSIDAFLKYVGRFPKDLPLVSVSSKIPGVPSVMIDNVSGMHAMVEHLIKEHGKRQIAFIRGPVGHYEAEERLKGYKSALEENGIEFDENYVLPGNFAVPSGRTAAIELLDNRKIPFDAIVASNDGMATTAMNLLIERGIRVHEDVAVTGFDDDILAIRAKPMLSSMRQDFFELGMIGAQVLCDVIDKKPIEELTLMSPFFVPRQSCGCFEKSLLENSDESFSSHGSDSADSLLSYALLKIPPLFKRSAPEDEIKQWVTALAEILKEKPFSRGKLLHSLYKAMDDYKKYSGKLKVWCEVLIELRECVLRFSDEVEQLRSPLSALFFAMMLVGDSRMMQKQTQEFDAADFRAVISKVTSSLILAFDTDTLAEELCNSLPLIHIDTVLVILYKNAVQSEDIDTDRGFDIVLGYDGQKKFYINYSASDIAPPHDFAGIEGFDFNRERRTLFFLPLFFMEMELGIVILPYDPRIPVEAYDTLRIDISTAVKGAELMSKIQALSTVDELTGLLNRRGFFHHAHSNLQHLGREPDPVIPIILFIDMDNLKGINDTHGHKEGDLAISAFAQILKDATRRVDVVGRMGGDEFVVFSSVKAMPNIEQLKSRINEKLDEYNAKKLHPFSLGCSIGSAVLDHLTMESLESAIGEADNMLYEEKARKKGWDKTKTSQT